MLQRVPQRMLQRVQRGSLRVPKPRPPRGPPCPRIALVTRRLAGPPEAPAEARRARDARELSPSVVQNPNLHAHRDGDQIKALVRNVGDKRVRGDFGSVRAGHGELRRNRRKGDLGASPAEDVDSNHSLHVLGTVGDGEKHLGSHGRSGSNGHAGGSAIERREGGEKRRTDATRSPAGKRQLTRDAHAASRDRNHSAGASPLPRAARIAVPRRATRARARGSRDGRDRRGCGRRLGPAPETASPTGPPPPSPQPGLACSRLFFFRP